MRFFARPRALARSGITLVEMLVAMALTLLLMFAIVNVFSMIGGSVAQGKSALEMSDRLRATRSLLQADLQGATCPTLPPRRPSEAVGYLEYVEGRETDASPQLGLPSVGVPALPVTPLSVADPSLLGDHDDVLMFTVRSKADPFVSHLEGTTVKSPLAEVVWYAIRDPDTYLSTIYRRVFLVAPWVETKLPATLPLQSWTIVSDPLESIRIFQERYDLSVRMDLNNGRIRPNTLGDLTKRENRYSHWWSDPSAAGGGYPHALRRQSLTVPLRDAPPLTPLGGQHSSTRLGEDVVLTNVLAWDVRIFDPQAVLSVASDNATVIGPGDRGWGTGGSMQTVGQGAYVDLGYGIPNNLGPGFSHFSDSPQPLSQLNSPPLPYRTYDTWSFHYEHDGVDQDGDGMTDEGTDGFDSDSSGAPGYGVVDDARERETAAPYAAPLRGIEVTLRVYDPDSRQVQQLVVRQSFVPEAR